MTTTTAIRRHGDTVTYLGRPATVTSGNEPDGWTPEPSPIVGIRFDAPVRGMSRQMDAPASALVTRKAA